MHEGTIELLVRGVLIGPHGVLLCRVIGKDYTFLPGGHIEFGESTSGALVREMREELGTKVEVESFLGALEHKFNQDGVKRHELNLVFLMSAPALERRAKVQAAESHIEFMWQSINMLTEANLQPKALRLLIPRWTRGKQEPWSSDLRDWL
ncbi:MAG TPA: NUDIX domain-containing protein [Anaerolineae bacterium]